MAEAIRNLRCDGEACKLCPNRRAAIDARVPLDEVMDRCRSLWGEGHVGHDDEAMTWRRILEPGQDGSAMCDDRCLREKEERENRK